MTTKPIFYVMGVSGCGKSTIGKLLSKNLAMPFFDGDDYHPEANVKKMEAGNPLNDFDRQGWLERLNQLAIEHGQSGAIIACSALKDAYRTMLTKDLPESYFVYLAGTYDEISARLAQRKDHFMPAALLQSQFNTLEVPKNAISVSIANTPEEIVTAIVSQYKLKSLDL